MSSGANATVVLELVDRLRKSWWTVVSGLCVGLAAATVALHYAPKTYNASTLIFVAPQQLPQEFVRSTVTDDMAIRLRSLKESVLSTPYLVRLVEEFVAKPTDAAALERLVAATRGRIDVDLIGISAASGEKTGGTFRLSYRDQDPKRAANMVNSLAKLYIEQNVSTRTAQAEDATKTIQGLADDVSSKIEAQQRSIAEFRRKHPYETADQQESNLQQLQGRQQDLSTNATARAAAQDRLTNLRAQEAVLGAATGAPSGLSAGLDSYAQRLAVLERELQVLHSKYTDTHPEVIAKTRELQEFKATISVAVAPGSEPAGQHLVTPLQASIQSAEREIQRRDADEVQVKRDIAEFKRRLEATPIVQAQLLELSKGYEVLLEQYKRRLGNAEEARGAQKIESSQKGERFEVIEPAMPPSVPISPVPAMIFGLGAFAGLLLFVGPLLAKTLLDPVICSEQGLLEAVDVPVLVSIPRVLTDEISAALRGRLVLNVTVSLVSVVVLVATTAIYH